jgi:uncharacterized protein (UPF0548 family)
LRIYLGHPPPSRATLARWRERPRTDEPRAGLRHDHYQRAVELAADDDPDAAFERAREALLRYRIFRLSVLHPLVDTPDGLTREGTTVAFTASPPFLPLSIEAAVRVVRTWDATIDGAREAGLEIATLAGHPERGWEQFSVRLDPPRRTLTFRIDAWSRPGSFLVRLGGPIGRWIQRRASNAALQEFTERAATGRRDRAEDAR